MLFRLAALALFALPAVSAQVNIGFTNCGTSDHITNIVATANIWPPVPGKQLDLVLSGDLDEVVQSGTYEAKVIFDWIPILDKTGDLSQLGVSLPMPKGSNVIKKSVVLPSFIPYGSITIHVTAKDQNNSELVCVDINTNIGDKFPSVMVHNFGFEEAATVPVNFTNCGSPSDLITVSSLQASVWPPVSGQALTVVGSGSSAEVITAGSFETKVSYSGVQLIDKKGDLSQITPLPVAAGPATLTKTITLPASLPAGPYSIQTSGVAQDGKSLGCVQIDFKL